MNVRIDLYAALTALTTILLSKLQNARSCRIFKRIDINHIHRFNMKLIETSHNQSHSYHELVNLLTLRPHSAHAPPPPFPQITGWLIICCIVYHAVQLSKIQKLKLHNLLCLQLFSTRSHSILLSEQGRWKWDWPNDKIVCNTDLFSGGAVRPMSMNSVSSTASWFSERGSSSSPASVPPVSSIPVPNEVDAAGRLLLSAIFPHAHWWMNFLRLIGWKYFPPYFYGIMNEWVKDEFSNLAVISWCINGAKIKRYHFEKKSDATYNFGYKMILHKLVISKFFKISYGSRSICYHSTAL